MPRGFSKFAAAGFGTCLILLCVVFALRNVELQIAGAARGRRAERAPSPRCARTTSSRGCSATKRRIRSAAAANMLVKGRLVERLTELGFRAGSAGRRHLQLQVAGVRPRAERARENRRSAAIQHSADGALRFGGLCARRGRRRRRRRDAARNRARAARRAASPATASCSRSPTVKKPDCSAPKRSSRSTPGPTTSRQ